MGCRESAKREWEGNSIIPRECRNLLFSPARQPKEVPMSSTWTGNPGRHLCLQEAGAALVASLLLSLDGSTAADHCQKTEKEPGSTGERTELSHQTKDLLKQIMNTCGHPSHVGMDPGYSSYQRWSLTQVPGWPLEKLVKTKVTMEAARKNIYRNNHLNNDIRNHGGRKK